MTEQHDHLCHRLRRLGFTTGTQMMLYGKVFDFLGEPIVMTEDVVLLDAREKKSGQTPRVPVPLPIVHLAKGGRSAA